jgi:acetyl esterase/lipase
MSLEERDAIVKLLRARRGPPPTAPEERRAGFAAFVAALWPDAPEPPAPFEIVPGLTGRLIPCPSGRTDRLMVWLHGGAFAVGSSVTHAPTLGLLAEAADCPVLLPDYRLLPDFQFPAALDDAKATLAWAIDRYDAASVLVGGDSAGGNLAVASVQARLGSCLPPPAGVVLHSPYLDLTEDAQSITSRAAQDPFVTPGTGVSEAYRRDIPASDPRVSPLFGTVKGFPPVLIQVGSDEVLFDDARRFACRVWEAGGLCVFQEWVAMFHCWQLASGRLAEGRWALAQSGAFARRILGG